MDDMRIEAYQVPEKPDYGPLARHLLSKGLIEKICEYFEDPENQKKYEEWLKEYKARKGA